MFTPTWFIDGGIYFEKITVAGNACINLLIPRVNLLQGLHVEQ